MMKQLKIEYSETLNLGNYQSLKPSLTELMQYENKSLTNEQEEKLRADFKEKVRQEYFALKKQMLDDFITFASQVKRLDIPSKN